MVHSLEEQTADTLRYLDDLRRRTNIENNNQTNLTWSIQENSNVIKAVSALKKNGGGDEYITEEIRLCELTSMLPTTSDNQGTLQLDYGLYTEGAGLLAMLHFNARDTSIVPDFELLQNCNVQFTMSFGNTQFSPIEACRVLSQQVMPILERPHSLQHPYPVSLVGATRSAVTAPLATLASVYELPVVSYGSTSSQLNLRDSYPYFGRTVPTNRGDATAAASYFREVLGVTHMGVLFVKDAYGSAFHKEFVQAAKQQSIIKVFSSPYDPNDGDDGMERALQLLKDSGYKFFYGIISTPTYDKVMRRAYQMGLAGPQESGGGMTWILSSSSGQILSNDYSYDATTESDLAAATNGVGVISLNVPNNPAFDQAWRMLEDNKAIKQYFVDKHDDPALDFSQFEFYDTPTYWDYLQYDAVVSLGFAACEATEEFFTGPQLFGSMMNTTFRGASGRVEFDAATGTRKTSSLSYKITNVVALPPTSDGSVYFATADTMQQDPTLNNTWIRIPESPPYVYSDNTTNQPPGLPPLNVEMNLIPTPILVVGLLLGSICILGSILSAAWTYRQRKSQPVRVAQPFFLLWVCGGAFLMGWSIIPMSFQEPMPQQVLDSGCMAIVWTFSSGFVVAFSALLSKTLRIYRLLRGGRSFKRVVINVQDVIRPFVALAGLNCSILLAWNIISPLRWTRIEMKSFDQFGRVTESYGVCQSDNLTLQRIFMGCLVGIDLAALVSANVVNYKARQISSQLQEASNIAVSMLILLEALLIGMPAMLAVSNNPPASFLIRSIVVSIVCGAVLFPIFLPKYQANRTEKKKRNTDGNNNNSRFGARSQYMSELVVDRKTKAARPSTVEQIRSQAMFSQIEHSEAISICSSNPSTPFKMNHSGHATTVRTTEVNNSAALFILPEANTFDEEGDEEEEKVDSFDDEDHPAEIIDLTDDIDLTSLDGELIDNNETSGGGGGGGSDDDDNDNHQHRLDITVSEKQVDNRDTFEDEAPDDSVGMYFM